METKSPVRSGRLGPSARWVCAIFSTMVWPIKSYSRSSILFFDLRPAHPALKRWANIVSCLRDCLGVALTLPFSLAFPLAFPLAFACAGGCLLPHICLHHSHQLAHGAHFLQIPDRVFKLLLRALREYAFCQCGEFLFN